MVSIVTDLRDLTAAECKAAMSSGGQLPQMTSSLEKGQLFNTKQRWLVALSGSAGGQIKQQQLRDQLGETAYRALCAENAAKGGKAGTPEQKEHRQKNRRISQPPLPHRSLLAPQECKKRQERWRGRIAPPVACSRQSKNLG